MNPASGTVFLGENNTVRHGVPTLEARGISVSSGKKTLLRDVSLEVKPCEVLALVGPNGAGKTTLLRALAGDIQPTRGEVVLDGRRLSSFDALTLAKRRAVLTQHTHLDFPFSALEVALLGRHPHGDENLEAARSCLQRADALHLAERDYTTLSGGEKQRVQLAQILTQLLGARDAFLLLDEPTSSLDLAHQHATLHLARELASEGVGVLCVLHDLNLAAAYADRVAVLMDGELCALGTPRDTLRPDLIERVFKLRVIVRDDPEAGLVIVPVQPSSLSSARF